MSRILGTTFTAALALSLAACGGGSSGANAYGGPVPVVSTPPTSQPSQFAGDAKQAQVNGATILVDANSGLALYTFSGDGPNQSNCTGGCLAIWPAHKAAAGETASGNFTIFTRSDGTLQWAYKGKPLYTFVSDTTNANATGNGLEGFSLATP